MNTIIEERERIRGARGRRLRELAITLGVQTPTLEEFVCGRANLARGLLTDIARILEQSNKIVPAPVARNVMKLNARSLKITAVLDVAELAALGDPGSSSRAVLEIFVAGQVLRADVASKSVRKAKAVISEHGADKVACFVQGKLDGNTIAEAGLVEQPKVQRAIAPS